MCRGSVVGSHETGKIETGRELDKLDKVERGRWKRLRESYVYLATRTIAMRLAGSLLSGGVLCRRG
jgi:hypothetical protein